ncbi:FHIPEP family type III secretion protein [Paenibacillus rhizoplanae]
MILPIPAWLLDVLLIVNISIALTIILVAMNTKDPLQFFNISFSASDHYAIPVSAELIHHQVDPGGWSCR